jgi:predicted Zn-dependent peptidase
MNGRVTRHVLSPKLCLVVDQQKHLVSASIGVFFGVGSRHEPKAYRGATHLAEHLFFKGTRRKSALEIAAVVEGVGGDINAYTDRECTCFHATVPAAEAFSAISLLIEVLVDPLFDPADFAREQEVVVEELKGYQDSPEDEFWDQAFERFWQGHPAGFRITGTARDVKKLSFESLESFIRNDFLSAPVVLSVSGPQDAKFWVRAIQRLRKDFGGARYAETFFSKLRKRPRGKAPRLPSQARWDLIQKSGSQVQLAIAVPAVAADHPLETAWLALVSHLGLGSTSRLYQEIREKRGLVYGTGAMLSNLADSGLLVAYLSSAPEKFFEAFAVLSEIFRSTSRGLATADLDFVKKSMAGAALLGFESSLQRMESLGRQQVLLGRLESIDQQLAEIEKLNLGTVNRLARSLGQKPFVFAYGPLGRSARAQMLRLWKERQ